MAQAPPTVDLVPLQAAWTGWYGRIGIVLAILVAAPIWIVTYPPLVDYPNHLARGYILYHLADVPDFAEHFETSYLTTPSLAMDGFMLALQPVCDVRLAGKLFLTLTLWLWLSGWHALGWAIHGRATWLALGGALFAYHSMFLYGFTNFSFGLGLFLWAAAAWMFWRRAWSWPRLLLMTSLALGCYFSHMAAYLFLAGTVLAVTGWEALMQRKITRPLLLGLLPILVPAAFFLRGGSGGGGIVWNTLQGKLIGALCLLRGYDRRIDLAFIAATVVFAVLFLVWSRRLQANGGVLLAGLGCVVMFLVGPVEIFGGSPADARFLPPASALVVLSLDCELPRRKALGLLGTFLCLVVFRYCLIAAYWRTFDADLGEQVALFEHFPRGAKVYPIVRVAGDADEQKLGVASFHAINYAVLDRHIYVPHLLAFPGQQPLRYKTLPLAYHASAEQYPRPAEAEWNKVFAAYDYLWCYAVPAEDLAYLERHATLVAAQGGGVILRVAKER
jgi:hypothetical protein